MKVLLSITMTLLVFLCNAQSYNISKDIEVRKGGACYCINNKPIFSITYKLYNKSNNNIWFWIEKDDYSLASDSARIKRYFIHKKDGSDASLYQIGMDNNVEVFTPEIFYTFVKCIVPKSSFILQVTSKDSISELTKQEMYNYMDKHFVFYQEKNLLKTIPSLSNMNHTIFFKEESISIDLDMLMK